MDTAVITDVLKEIGLVLGGILGTVLWVRRKLSKDNVEIKEDQKKRDWLSDITHKQEAAEKEIVRLRELLDIERKATSDAKTKALLIQGDYDQLARLYERLRKKAQRMAAKMNQHGLMDPVDARDFDTRFAGLDDMPPRGKE